MDWEAANPGTPTKRVMTGIHQADFLGNFTIDHAAKAVKSNRPFFISVTPVMPHWGTCYGPGPPSVYPAYDPHWEWNLPGGLSMPISPCPTTRNRHRFDTQSNPRIPGVHVIRYVATCYFLDVGCHVQTFVFGIPVALWQ
jgi:hypothetical protein